jgi:hypothetical protein
MKTVRFRTRVSKLGTIQVPSDYLLVNKEVDVIIVSKTRRTSKKMKASEFVNKWTGVLFPMENEDPKSDYLMEKYK